MAEPQSIVSPAVNPPLIQAAVTVLTNFTGNLTKTFTMNSEGQIKKLAAAKLVRGTFEVREVTDLAQLDMLLESLKPSQAVTYGRPTASSGNVVAKDVTEPTPGAITRTRENFQFAGGPGVLMLDYDPLKDQPAIASADLIDMLRKSCPFLAGVGMLWRPSASSGVEGAGIRGQRIYIMVNDASEIKRIGDTIFNRLWLAGLGYYVISMSGQVLERAPIDASVWKPEGLDFAAAPVLGTGITRVKYDSQVFDGHPLDAQVVADLSVVETAELKSMKVAAREAIKPHVMATKAKYIADAAPVLTERLMKLSAETDNDFIGVMLVW